MGDMDHTAFEQLFIFEKLSPEQRALLEPLLTPCDYYTGATIFEQGDPAEYLYAIVLGEVVVSFKPDDGPAIIVARVRPGSVVGWSAAIGRRRYTSGATCTEYTQLLRLRGNDLRKLCKECPDTGALVLDSLATVIAERLNSTHDLVMSLLKLGLDNQEGQPGG